MRKTLENENDIRDILFEQVTKLAEINNTVEPEQVRKNTETILLIYCELSRF